MSEWLRSLVIAACHHRTRSSGDKNPQPNSPETQTLQAEIYGKSLLSQASIAVNVSCSGL